MSFFSDILWSTLQKKIVYPLHYFENFTASDSTINQLPTTGMTRFKLYICGLKHHVYVASRGPPGESGVTVKNIPSREIIPPVYFRVQKSVKNIPGVCFCIRQYVIGNTYNML